MKETFPHLENINDSNFDHESISSEAQFYVLRSGNDDNIHKVLHLFARLIQILCKGNQISSMVHNNKWEECS